MENSDLSGNDAVAAEAVDANLQAPLGEAVDPNADDGKNKTTTDPNLDSGGNPLVTRTRLSIPMQMIMVRQRLISIPVSLLCGLGLVLPLWQMKTLLSVSQAS